MEKRTNNSTYIPILIIFALVPQMLKFNGSLIDTAWKLILMFGILFFCYNACVKERVFRVRGTEFVYLSLFCAVSILSAFLSEGSLVSDVEAMLFQVIMFFIFYQTTSWQDYNTSDIYRFFSLIVNFMMIACVYNLIFNFSSFIHLTDNNLYDTATGVSSVFDNKNAFGLFLTYGIIGAMGLKMTTKEKKWNFYVIFFMLNALVALCRTAIVVSALVIACCILLDSKKIFRNIIILVAIIGICLLIINFVPAIHDFVVRNSESTSSVDSRVDQWESLLPLVKGEHAVFGYGPSFSKILTKMYSAKSYFHSTYLYIILCYGWLGVLCFSIIVIDALKRSIRILRMKYSYGVVCLASVFAYLVFSLSEKYMLFDTPVVSMTVTAFTISIPLMVEKAIKKEIREK